MTDNVKICNKQKMTNSCSEQQINWEHYGLKSNDVNQVDDSFEIDEFHDKRSTAQNELFALDQSSLSKPWWKTHFLFSEPILFGTWDGVFTSCMINLFGVIIFLRSGWIVGEAGIVCSFLVVVLAVVIIIASVFAGIGICERCTVDRGGVYFLLSHVLGARIGGPVGLIYCFGQAVSAALHSIGFGEAIGKLLGVNDIWIERAIAVSLLVLLVVINIAGVAWVIKLQFFLLLILLLAALDFTVGSCVRTNPKFGVDGYYSSNFWNNSLPAYTENNSLSTVFGIFFPALTGVFAGFNMSGDLRNPRKDIPAGTLSSIGVCFFIYLAFIFVLGATCQREALLTNYLIAEKVSAIGAFFLAGLYMSSVSACLGTLYGTPRILQSIATENVIPFLKILGRGRGPNKIPVFGICAIAIITLVFILIGKINTLAPVVTMPFLLTYATINYAYFSLAMTAEAWDKRDERFRFQNHELSNSTQPNEPNFYGATSNSPPPGKQCEKNPDYQLICKEVGLTSSLEEKTLFQKSHDGGNNPSNEFISDEIRHNMISQLPQRWYSVFCNRWIALVGVIANMMIMFFVQWLYAILHLIFWLAMYVYIGKVSPGVSPGIADFKFCSWIKKCFHKLFGMASEEDSLIVTQVDPSFDVLAAQLTERNEDFANREYYHQSLIVKGTKFEHLNNNTVEPQ